ncbi:MAG: hypothetical protein ABEL76_01905 [Bradymonadaceae bacterium]
MKKTFGTILAFFAVLAFSSPVWACGGKKSKSDMSTTAKKNQKQTAEKTSDSADESEEEKSGEATKS